MKKFAGLLMAFGMMAGLLSGCAEAQVQAEESEIERIDPIAVNGIDYQSVFGITLEPGSEIVMIAKGNANQYWSAVRDGAEHAVEDLNASLGYEGSDEIKLVYEAPDVENDVEEQINMLYEILENQPAALALAIIDMKSCEFQLEQAQENDIPVVAFDSGKNSDIVQATCATDHYEAAARAAQELCDAIGGKGQLAVLLADDSSEAGVQRRDGFMDKIQADYPEVEVVNVSYMLDQDMTAEEIAEQVIRQYPQLDGYFGGNEAASIGILDAAGKLPDSQLKIVGFDSGQEQIEAVKEGREVGFITQKPYAIGYTTIIAAARAAAGMPNASEINTGFVWVNADNLENERIARNLYE